MSNATPLVGDDVLTRRMDDSLAYTARERTARLARAVTEYGTGSLTPAQSLLDLAAVAGWDDPGIVVLPCVASRWAGAVLAALDGALTPDDLANVRAHLARAAGIFDVSPSPEPTPDAG